MSLSESQLYAISATERVCSAISLTGTTIIVVSFLSSNAFRKPINRLVFYASWGNMMANIATVISQSGIHAGINSPLCQFQAFLIQWFMPADALWTFAMACNVYLTFFHKYNYEQLRRLENKYLIFCYGLPFIPALAYFFIKTKARGSVYGYAVLWCWVSQTWDILRIAVFYGPVWFFIVLTFAIYVRTGRVIWERRRQLQQLDNIGSGSSNLRSEGDQTTEEYDQFELHQTPCPLAPTHTRTTEIRVTSEITRFQHGYHPTAEELCNPVSPFYNPYSVTIEGGLVGRQAHGPLLKPKGHSESWSRRRAMSDTSTAAWAYTKYAMLFFIALLVTWVPSTINRAYAFAYPHSLSFALNYVSSFYYHKNMAEDNTNPNSSRQAASPSPPPPAPVPVTPGPRATVLQKTYNQALLRTLKANSYANFSGCFPTPAKHVPASLESVWRQLNAKLEEGARAEFEDIIRERDAVGQLNELDRLMGEARHRRDHGQGESDVAPHTLTPEELYHARLSPHLQEARAALHTRIASTQQENEALSQRVQSQRLEIERLLSNLESVVADLGGAASAATQFSGQNGLRKEAMNMEEDVKARSDM
ncbi:Nnf1-domain-containing protein [Aspergillus avenaceus]|uniref:Nnf1-domain-containing protein n=1 Tax=Aspergillus avenaceus TaxID=36643 RepID=A0A5N6TEX0_ASPAV|nr:Nnf1-domain-containing protein [Aspergillus avenaceus]